MDRGAVCTALFDTGSGYTVIQRSFFEENFGANWLRLPRPIKLYLINGESIEADKYAQVTIVIDGIELLPPEIALVVRFVREVEVEGRKLKPEVIIGSGSMDKYGIVLDPREGVKPTGATLLLQLLKGSGLHILRSP
mgnify:CR=1 FL=1